MTPSQKIAEHHAATAAAKSKRDQVARLIHDHLTEAGEIRRNIEIADDAERTALEVLGSRLADEAIGAANPGAIMDARSTLANQRKIAVEARKGVNTAIEAESAARALQAHLVAADEVLSAAADAENHAVAEALRTTAGNLAHAYEESAAATANAFAAYCALSDIWTTRLGKDCGILPPVAMTIRLPALRGVDTDILTQKSHREAVAGAHASLNTELAGLGVTP